MPWFWNLTGQWQATYLGSKFQGEVPPPPYIASNVLDHALCHLLLRRPNPLELNQHPLVTLLHLCNRRKVRLQQTNSQIILPRLGTHTRPHHHHWSTTPCCVPQNRGLLWKTQSCVLCHDFPSHCSNRHDRFVSDSYSTFVQ